MGKASLMRLVLFVILVAMLLWGMVALTVLADTTVYHTVRWGESLYWIAWRYGVSIQDIVQANSLKNPNLIYAGQKLLIPNQEEYVEHTVLPGETLSGIAARYGVRVWDIARRNGIWNINLIFVGQKLVIPGGGEGTPAPQASAPQSEAEIVITSPKANEQVSSPVTVTGWGSAFENRLAIDVLDEKGNVIGQGYALVDAEIGQRGPFSGTVKFNPPSTAQMGRISVYRISPRDGAIEQLTSVTVKLQP